MIDAALDRRTRAVGQAGYLLITTLALILFFSVTLIAVLSMTMTAAITTAQRVDRSDNLRLADSALEAVINARRLDRLSAASATTAGVPCPGTTTVGTVANAYAQSVKRSNGTTETVAVSCSGSGSSTGRQFTLKAYVGGSLVGMAAARLDDSAEPGEGLLICDWQLGANASAEPATCS